MNKFTTISIVALAAFVSGCTEWGNPPFRNAIPAETGPWKPEVQRQSHEDDIVFAHGSSTINHAGIEKLKDLVGKTTVAPPVHVRIMTHRTRADANTPVIEQRVGTIVRCLKKIGDVDPDNVEVIYLTEADSGKANVMTVTLNQYIAIAPKCPGWNEYMNTYGMPEGEANFGCTTASNLAQMVDDPYYMSRDKKDPTLGDADGARQNLFVHKYRTDKIRPLKIEKVDIN